jgi:hypothetical protein
VERIVGKTQKERVKGEKKRERIRESERERESGKRRIKADEREGEQRDQTESNVERRLPELLCFSEVPYRSAR